MSRSLAGSCSFAAIMGPFLVGFLSRLTRDSGTGVLSRIILSVAWS